MSIGSAPKHLDVERPLAAIPALTERAFQQQVVTFARVMGWRTYHTADSRRSDPGFPDLVLVRERVVYAELKRDGRYPTPIQHEWKAALDEAGAEAYVWKPKDWSEITRILSR